MIDSIYIPTLLSVALLQTLAVISPGPDFALVTRNSIVYSRRIGIYTGLGIVAGISFHMLYMVLGFGLIVAGLTNLLFAIKIAGAAYLIYLGMKSLRAAGKWHFARNAMPNAPEISAQSAFWSGFLTNALNPKAILFLISLFTVVLDEKTPRSVLLACALMIIAITFAWFMFVAITFSGKLREYLLKCASWVDRATGGFLLFIGAKIGLTCFEIN